MIRPTNRHDSNPAQGQGGLPVEQQREHAQTYDSGPHGVVPDDRTRWTSTLPSGSG